MNSLSGRSLTWAAALLLLVPAAARADFYSNWSFSWNFNAIPPNAAGFVPADSGAAPSGTATGGAQFAAQSGATGSSTIPVALVSTTSSATTTPDSFQGTAFSFGVTITDNANNASGTLTFDGVLNGKLTTTSSTAFATFALDPNSPASLTLNGHTYTVMINGELGQGSGLPAPGGQKLLDATVNVNPAGGPPPPVQSVPEPSAFALAGVAVAALGLAGWWRRRGVAPQAS